ncbi:hypothetical protein Bca4012_042554 [Brassica carinata]
MELIDWSSLALILSPTPHTRSVKISPTSRLNHRMLFGIFLWALRESSSLHLNHSRMLHVHVPLTPPLTVVNLTKTASSSDYSG